MDSAGQNGRVRVSRRGIAADIEDAPGGLPKVDTAGIVHGSDIAHLVHGGYQMFFRTPGGKMIPALAQHLKGLHAFEEDLREALGLTSLYNEALGTRCEEHLYDRVKGRE